MTIHTVATTPIAGQKPGTSGLRKKTPVFMGRHYLRVSGVRVPCAGSPEGRRYHPALCGAAGPTPSPVARCGPAHPPIPDPAGGATARRAMSPARPCD